jgi:hypothetical protein
MLLQSCILLVFLLTTFDIHYKLAIHSSSVTDSQQLGKQNCTFWCHNKTALLKSQPIWIQTQALRRDTMVGHQLQTTNMTTEEILVFAPKPQRTRQASTSLSRTPHNWRLETDDRYRPYCQRNWVSAILYASVEFYLMFIGLRKRTLQPLLKKDDPSSYT